MYHLHVGGVIRVKLLLFIQMYFNNYCYGQSVKIGLKFDVFTIQERWSWVSQMLRAMWASCCWYHWASAADPGTEEGLIRS